MQTRACSHHDWRRSLEWRAIARAAILKFHAGRHLLPKCGAIKKSSGEPCQNLPSPGRTRCRLHGGATPKGSGPIGWHTPAFPGGMPTGKPRSDAYKKRRRWKSIERVEAMTPEEKARYDAWQVSHAPGSAKMRARRRHNRETAGWLQDLMSAQPADATKPAKRQRRKPPSLNAAIRDGIGVFE